MRRMAMVAAVLAAAGCSDSTSPESRVPATGRYAYTITGNAGTAGDYRDAGTLRITAATEEHLTGTIQSDGANFGFGQDPQPAVAWESIGWNVDAYVVMADLPYALYSLRLARDGGNLRCSGRLITGGSRGGSYPASCTVTWVGP